MPARSFASRKVVIGLPVIASIVLTLVAGGLQTVSQVLLTSHPQIQGVIVVFITFLVAEGIDPATGATFVALLKLPPWALHLIAALLTAVAGLTQILSLSHGWHIALVDVLTILAALGFGTQPSEPPGPLFASAPPAGLAPGVTAQVTQ